MYEDTITAGQGDQIETPPFEQGIGGTVGGEVHIDGTPFRIVTIVAVGIGILILFNLANFRWHVVI